MEQNIISIGYDPKFQPEIDSITKSLQQQYELLKKIDETKISPGSGGGYTELKAQVDALAKSNKELMDSNVKMAQSLADLKNKQTEAVSVTKQFVAANQQVSLSYTDAIKKLNDAKSALAANAQLQKELTKDVKAGKISADEYRLKITQLTNTQLKYKETITQLNKEVKDQTKNALGLISPYDALSKKYNEAAKNAQNLAAQFGANSVQAKAAAKTANGLHLELLNIDQTIGKSQRNVGNYAGGIQKAFSGLRTLAYILPGLGLSGVILLLATPFIALANAVDFAGAKLTEYIANRKMLTDIQYAGNKAASEELTNLKLVYAATQNDSLSKKEKYKAVKYLQDQWPETYKQYTAEEILLGKAKTATDNLTESILKNALAQAAKTKLTELGNEELDLYTKFQEKKNKIDQDLSAGSGVSKMTDEQLAARDNLANKNQIKRARINAQEYTRARLKDADDNQNEYNEGLKKLRARQQLIIDFIGAGSLIEGLFGKKDKNNKDAKDLKELADKTAEEILRINYEMSKRVQQRNIDDAKALIDSDNITYQQRLKALSNYMDAKLAMTEIDRQYEIDAEALKYKEIQENLDKQKPDETKGGQAAITAQRQKEQQAHFLRLLNIESKYYEERRKLGAEYLADIKKQEEKREADAKKAFDEDLKRQADKVKAGRAILDADEAYRDKKRKERIAKEKALQKQLFDFAKEFTEKALTLVQTLVDAGYTRQQNAIQKLIQANDEYQGAETERIQNSTLNEQEKAAKVITLNATVAAKNKQLAYEQKELDIKKAQFDKQIAIAKIGLSIAMGVANEFATKGYPAGLLTAAMIAALGAAELAIAIATPIPTYAEGTDNHPGGPAIYGEAGAELVKEPGKAAYVVDRATYGILPAGTKVKPLTGDYINEAMYGSMITSQAERMALAEAIDNRQAKTDWAIARYLAGELKQQPQRRQAIQVVNKIDLGFAGYINKQIFGR